MTIRSSQPRPGSLPASAPAEASLSFWNSAVLWLALTGGLLLWAAFPPLNLWPLAWIAPLPWLLLVRLPQLPGRRPYVAIGLAGFMQWLLLLEGIRRAHPALYAGWIVLAAYLACYLPIFVGLARVAVHRLGVSIAVAAPTVWVGLEMVRGHFATGFSAALLGHSQAEWTMLVQIADLAGGYTVSFLVMLVAACAAQAMPIPPAFSPAPPSQRGTLWPLAVAAGALAATLGYGAFRLREPLAESGRDPLHVALIQGSLDTQIESDPARSQQRMRETYEHYRALSERARRENPRLDLVIWPESSFVIPESRVEEPLRPPADANLSPDEFRRRIAASNDDFQAMLAAEAARVNRLADGQAQPGPTLLLVCGTTFAWNGDRPKSYNTAFLADPQGAVIGRYHKMHAVMFGEYIPLGETFPWIYRIVPVVGMSVGDRARAFDVSGLRISPSICFESVVPHLIRRQVLDLQTHGRPVDLLVNVTNDGWFWGSAILDHHFRCGLFRAIENRKPLLIAANTGISAAIDGNGRVIARGPRRQPTILFVAAPTDGRTSPYHLIGDLPAGLCALACLALAILGWRKRPAGK